MTLRDDFLIDPTVTFLNHGSYGAVPRPVFEAYQRWLMEAERQPVEFFRRRYDGLMDQARAQMAHYVNAPADNLILMPNATMALNMVARSIPLQAGDEVLTTDHEYGAMDMMWQHLTQKAGAVYRAVALPDPIQNAEQVTQTFIAQITDRTRVVYLSHITSPTALILPIEPIIHAARQRGILTIIDGAHAVGQIPMDMQALGADVYTSNCHKWLCAPRSAAFLYVRQELHSQIEPLVISWGFEPGSSFAVQNQWQGTQSIAAYLSVPDAIAYQRDNDWDTVRERCHALASDTRARLLQMLGTRPLSPDSPDWYGQMVALELPPMADYEAFKAALYDNHRVEVPVAYRGTRAYLRVSYQGYNNAQDMERLLDAVEQTLARQPITSESRP